MLTGDETLTGGPGDDTLLGLDGNDVLYGAEGDDLLDGGEGADFLSGEDGNDTLVDGPGDDTLSGGPGADTADFSGRGTGINARLDDNVVELGGLFSGGVYTGATERNAIFGVEHVTGTDHGDIILGKFGSAGLLIGGAGDDSIVGGGLSDTIMDGSGNDTVVAGNRYRNDPDTVYAGDGNDHYDGGAGDDLIDFLFSSTGVSVDLNTGVGLAGGATLPGGAYAGATETDRIVGFERMNGSRYGDRLVSLEDEAGTIRGGEGDDYILASSRGDRVWGEDGDDTILTGSGNDWIYGGYGNDMINGGRHVDTLYYGEPYADIVGGIYVDLENHVLMTGGSVVGGTYVGATGIGRIYGVEHVSATDSNDILVAKAGSAAYIWTGRGDDHVTGGDMNDTVRAYGGDDTVLAGAGHDSVEIYGGDDVLDGGAGDDTLHVFQGGALFYDLAGNTIHSGGSLGTDGIYSGATGAIAVQGFEHLLAGGGDDLFVGADSGKVDFRAGAGNDRILGGAAQETLSGDAGDDFIDAGAGNDVILASDGEDTIEGGAGFDTLDASGMRGVMIDLATGVALTGGYVTWDTGIYRDADWTVAIHGIERLVGSSQRDILIAGDARGARIDGGAGEDRIFGGSMNDVIRDGSNGDSVHAGAGADTIIPGGDWNDLFNGGADFDTVDLSEETRGVFVDLEAHRLRMGGTLDGGGTYAGGRQSAIYGTENAVGTAMADYLKAKIGSAAELVGGGGNDRLTGGDMNDRLYGDAGADTLQGGSGHDVLESGSGDDFIFAGSGADTVAGGAGDDVLDLGAGAKRVIFATGDGRDTITGFDSGDVLELVGYGADFASGAEVLSALGDGVSGAELALSDGGMLIFDGRFTADFEAGDFVLS